MLMGLSKTEALVWFVVGVLIAMLAVGCGNPGSSVAPGPVAVSGVREVKPEVKVGADGLTVEQRNIRDRLKMDSEPGSIKHLYIISAYSGDVLIYSTVRGKVTSSGKRLSPTTVYAGMVETTNGPVRREGIPVNIGGYQRHTPEVLQDDGTYGSSIDYLYWFSADGRYHQQYVTGGMMVHVSDQPIAVRKVIMNLESKHIEDK